MEAHVVSIMDALLTTAPGLGTWQSDGQEQRQAERTESINGLREWKHYRAELYSVLLRSSSQRGHIQMVFISIVFVTERCKSLSIFC